MDSTQPATTERAAPRVPPRNILVAVDFSAPSLAALEWALEYARYFGATVHVLHVIEPLPYPADLTYVPMGNVLPLNAAHERLELLVQQRIEPARRGETLEHLGHASEEITGLARRMDIDLLVIGTHGYTGLKHVFLGSTAERVVRHAHCPVLSIHIQPSAQGTSKAGFVS